MENSSSTFYSQKNVEKILFLVGKNISFLTEYIRCQAY